MRTLMQRTLLLAIAILGIFIFGRVSFIVSETEKALVLRFGEYKRTLETPGLHFKLPFVDEALFLDKRLNLFVVPQQEIIAGNQERIVVDVYLNYKIENALLYYQAVQNRTGAEVRLTTIVYGSLRSVIAKHPLFSLVSKRSNIMGEILSKVQQACAPLGIFVKDLRIQRADLPKENSLAIFRRMRTERQIMATELRSQGEELAQAARAEADKARAILIADAKKQASILIGQGEAQSMEIMNQVIGKNAEFFEIYNFLKVYAKAMKNNLLVLPAEHDFLKHLTNK